jgi:hypothetical protein
LASQDNSSLVSELLATVITQPLAAGKQVQTVWTIDEVDVAGRRYLQWLHDVRHKGTFSSIASAFQDVVDAVKKTPDLARLADHWLEVSCAVA